MFADEAAAIYERAITTLLKNNMLLYFAYADFEEVGIYIALLEFCRYFLPFENVIIGKFILSESDEVRKSAQHLQAVNSCSRYRLNAGMRIHILAGIYYISLL